jgi:hypothetical protein
MAAQTPEEHLTSYVINYYGGYMTAPEWLAYRMFIMERKVQHGYSTSLLDDIDRKLTDEGYEPIRTTNPEAVSLMRDGVGVFLRRVRDRILREHQDRVRLNYCPVCGGLATTPNAQQCQWCFHRWHGRERSSSG